MLQALCKWSVCWGLLAVSIHAAASVMWHFAHIKTIDPEESMSAPPKIKCAGERSSQKQESTSKHVLWFEYCWAVLTFC